jgi:hypothetical protein
MGEIGAVTAVTEVRMRGRAQLAIMPPRPCAFGDCVAEIVITLNGIQARVHVNDEGRSDVVAGLLRTGEGGS